MNFNQIHIVNSSNYTHMTVSNQYASWTIPSTILPTTEEVESGLFRKADTMTVSSGIVETRNDIALDYQDGGLTLTVFLDADEFSMEHHVVFCGGELPYLLEVLGILGDRQKAVERGDVLTPLVLPTAPDGLMVELRDWTREDE